MTARGEDRALRQTFRFEAADLRANRAGILSPGQAALLRAGRAGMLLSLAVFSVVMLGSVGLVVFFNWRLAAPGGWTTGLGVPVAVAVIVIVIGWLLSRGHLATARSRQLSVARGPAEVLSDAADDCRVRIGATPLRLASPAQLEAFRPGAEYRVYYLAGPVPVVLSAETLPAAGTERADEEGAAANAAEAATAGEQIALVRRGYVVVVLLGILALGIPVTAALIGGLPRGLQPVAWIGLGAVASGFAWLARAWLRPRRGRRR